jgi:hypothetical protein
LHHNVPFHTALSVMFNSWLRNIYQSSNIHCIHLI